MQQEVVERLFTLFIQSGAAEMEYRDGGDLLKLSRTAAGGVPAAPTAMAAPATPAAAPSPAAAQPTGAESDPAAVSAPLSPAQHVLQAGLTGNFYRRSAPDAPPYAEVGAIVEEGQVLGLIETMKLLNEVEADRAGRIVAFHVENGKPVKAGSPLVVIEPVEAADV